MYKLKKPATAKTEDAKTEEANQDKMQRMLELMSKKIEMEVNTDLFKPEGANSYVSEDPKAVIMAMMVPDSYENSKMKMEKDAGGGMTITEKGEKRSERSYCVIHERYYRSGRFYLKR